LPLASVSVDLDSLGHYCRIHGLDPRGLPGSARRLVYREALARFAALFAELGLTATFFAVGEDLEEDPEARAALARAAREGHEVGNHSGAHDYALTRLPLEAIALDVERGERAVAQATGRRPSGFRAPGYALSAPLLGVLAARGYRYDSSAFPAAPYYVAKAAVMAGLRLLGRPSHAVLDRPRVLLAPHGPYRPDREEPYRRGGMPLIELPIAVEPWTRIPFIGTAVVAIPERAAAILYRRMRRAEHLNLELHGIDLLDAADVGFAPLARAQRDLGIPAARKRERLAAVLRRMREDFEVLTLEGAAERIAGRWGT
jgi:peptidoglycan/xylan/chitin deacetylase (PgdA/CDA1 family)